LVDAPRLLAAVACERGEPEQALGWLTGAVEATGYRPRLGQSGAFLLGRGRCLVLLGRPAEALPDLTAAVAELDPDWDVADYVLALQLRSRARRETGDVEGALADSDRLAAHLWQRHRRYVGGFIDQVFSRAGAERERRQLQQHADQLSRTAEQDPLTNLDNRRAMERFLRERGAEEPVCLVMIDVDHFKEVNDGFGHLVGDEVLRRIAGLLRGSVRGVDRVARWGGEEFLVALPGHGRALGLDAAERLRSVIVEQTWHDLGADVAVTISAGVACGPAGTIDETLLRADAALYEAKRSGRNTVVGG
jgi:diguanylate cyclase (GGDEF)-like protein